MQREIAVNAVGLNSESALGYLSFVNQDDKKLLPTCALGAVIEPGRKVEAEILVSHLRIRN